MPRDRIENRGVCRVAYEIDCKSMVGDIAGDPEAIWILARCKRETITFLSVQMDPVLGDKVYATRPAKDFSRQMLHAWKLGFRHPNTGDRKSFEAPMPDDFATAMKMTSEI